MMYSQTNTFSNDPGGNGAGGAVETGPARGRCRDAVRAPAAPRSGRGALAAAILCGLVLGACSDDAPSQPPDASPIPDARPDATPGPTPDASMPPAPDASVPDAAVLDAAVPDAAVPDAAVPDAAVPDAIVSDAAPRPPVTVSPLGRLVGGVHGMAVSDTGRLFYSDSFRNQATPAQVYYLDPPYAGPPVATGITATLPAGLLWENGSLLLCDTQTGQVRQFDESFAQVRQWTGSAPWNVARDASGDLLIITYNGALQRLNDDGSATTLFSGLDAPFDLAPAPDGTVWISEQGATAPGKVTRRTLDGTIVESIEHAWENPEGLLLDEQGTLWIAETSAGAILRYDAGGLEVVDDTLTLPIVLTPHSPGVILVNARRDGLSQVFQIEVGK